MFDKLNQVSEVLEATTMTAAEMTHSLCELGGGDMGRGIYEIFDSGLQVGFVVGNIRGIIKGATAATVVIGGTALVIGGGVLISRKIKEQKKKKLLIQPEATKS